MPQDSLVPAISREKIMHALYEAAEIEHCLMCTYLYAAFSLRDGEGEGLTAEEALSGAPEAEQQRFSVPRILGDEQ